MEGSDEENEILFQARKEHPQENASSADSTPIAPSSRKKQKIIQAGINNDLSRVIRNVPRIPGLGSEVLGDGSNKRNNPRRIIPRSPASFGPPGSPASFGGVMNNNRSTHQQVSLGPHLLGIQKPETRGPEMLGSGYGRPTSSTSIPLEVATGAGLTTTTTPLSQGEIILGKNTRKMKSSGNSSAEFGIQNGSSTVGFDTINGEFDTSGGNFLAEAAGRRLSHESLSENADHSPEEEDRREKDLPEQNPDFEWLATEVVRLGRLR